MIPPCHPHETPGLCRADAKRGGQLTGTFVGLDLDPATGEREDRAAAGRDDHPAPPFGRADHECTAPSKGRARRVDQQPDPDLGSRRERCPDGTLRQSGRDGWTSGGTGGRCGGLGLGKRDFGRLAPSASHREDQGEREGAAHSAQLRKLPNLSATPTSAVRRKAITSWSSSLEGLETRTSSPWIDDWTFLNP